VLVVLQESGIQAGFNGNPGMNLLTEFLVEMSLTG
jgi:hypothetical protein